MPPASGLLLAVVAVAAHGPFARAHLSYLRFGFQSGNGKGDLMTTTDNVMAGPMADASDLLEWTGSTEPFRAGDTRTFRIGSSYESWLGAVGVGAADQGTFTGGGTGAAAKTFHLFNTGGAFVADEFTWTAPADVSGLSEVRIEAIAGPSNGYVQLTRQTLTLAKAADDGACSGVVDACGECGGDGSSCADCAGVPNGGDDSCAGCDGVRDSGLVEDVCGVCGGDGSSCVGCDGVVLSGKVRDLCGVCGGDGSTCAAGDPTRLLMKDDFAFATVVQHGSGTVDADRRMGLAWTLLGADGKAVGTPSAATAVRVGARASVGGYVSVAFAATPGRMAGADAVYGWIDGAGQARVVAYSLGANAAGTSKGDGFVSDAAVTESGGHTTLTFTRTLGTGASGDVALSATGDTPLLWASTLADPAGAVPSMHDGVHRGAVTVDFSKGGSRIVEASRSAVVFFWAALAGLLVAAAAATHAPCGGRLARCCQRRAASPPAWATARGGCARAADDLALNAPSTLVDYTLAEHLLLLAILGGCAAFLALKETRDAVTSPKAWGYLSSSLLFVATLPTHKHGVWGFVFGSSFERAVKWHRTCARLFLLSQCVHLWKVLDFFRVLNEEREQGVGGAPGAQGSHLQTQGASAVEPVGILNYKAGYVEAKYGFFAFCCSCAMALLALALVRRKAFSIFYATHVPLFLAVNAMVWMHVADPVSRTMVAAAVGCWALDWLWRPARAALAARGGGSSPGAARTAHFGAVDVVSATALRGGRDGAVRLVCRLPGGAALQHAAGDFCYVRIPEVREGLLAKSHPYSICTRPGVPDGTFAFTIKSSGPGCCAERGFGADLRRLVDRRADDAKPFVPRVLVDGPYGRLSLPLPPASYDGVALVGGGIGITPLASVFSDLAFDRGSRARRVTLYWTVRTREEAGWFLEQLEEAAAQGQKGGRCAFTVVVFTTRASKGGGADGGRVSAMEAVEAGLELATTKAQVKGTGGAQRATRVAQAVDARSNGVFFEVGRPNVDALIRNDFPRSEFGPRAAVLACGPAPLVAAAQGAARAQGADFHKESFVM
jgi:ferredoxin-NADP reductase